MARYLQASNCRSKCSLKAAAVGLCRLLVLSERPMPPNSLQNRGRTVSSGGHGNDIPGVGTELEQSWSLAFVGILPAIQLVSD